MSRLGLTELRARHAAGTAIACMTAYDASLAAAMDEAGMDILLVGDSLGMVLHGAPDTLGVSVGDIIYHTRQVVRGSRHALVAADMPYMSYATPAQALGNASRILAEGGAQMVKLEGGAWLAATVSLLVERGIPVWAHVGLTPQSVHALGGFRTVGRSAAEHEQVLQDAAALEAAGACMLLVECIPPRLAREVVAQSRVPVIGIGAGADCDGQILVCYDALGVAPQRPRFTRDFLAGRPGVRAACEAYVSAVRERSFPADGESVGGTD
jgi:3-methyl-2-oxobutanoate hydroxymethyltransferase